MPASYEAPGAGPPAGPLGWRITAAYVLLGGFVAASLAFALLVYLPLQIDFCDFDPQEQQCVDRESGGKWPSVIRWGLWIAAALACVGTLVFAYRSETYPHATRRFVVSAAVALALIAATAAAAYPLTTLE